MRRTMLIIGALFLSAVSCITNNSIENPGLDRGWDQAVSGALQDAHDLLVRIQDPLIQIDSAVQLSWALFDMGAVEESEYYLSYAVVWCSEQLQEQIEEKQSAEEAVQIDERDRRLWDASVSLISQLFRLEKPEKAEQIITPLLDLLTLSGESSLQADYFYRILDIVLSSGQGDAHLYRQITDRILFISDSAMRAETLRRTLERMWQIGIKGDVSSLAQHAAAALSGMDERVPQAAGMLYLAGILRLMDQSVRGLESDRLMDRGIGLWRSADMWAVEKNNAALATRGGLLTGRDTFVNEVLTSLPGAIARIDILLDQAGWFASSGLPQQARSLLQRVENEIASLPELAANPALYSLQIRLALGWQQLGNMQAVEAIAAASASWREIFWYDQPETALALCQILAAGVPPTQANERIAAVIAALRSPEDRALVYTRLYVLAPASQLDFLQSLVLRELPFLLRRVDWGSKNQFSQDIEGLIRRAAQRGDTALLAELRSIRPPEAHRVGIEARYAHALIVREQ